MIRKQITDLNNLECKEYFLKNENYFNNSLPKYINFENILKELSKEMGEKTYKQLKQEEPKNQENINYRFLYSKDTKYDWRPLEIIHPVLYISLINVITKAENWEALLSILKNRKNNSTIECVSEPIIPIKNEKKVGAEIKEWWNNVEQKTLELALDYRFLYTADISNCYSSIYTHSISWAIHGLEEAKNKRSDKKLLGNIVDDHIQAMSYGQTNGIPQGSVLMDFIVEIILYYADEMITEKLIKSDIEEYKIIRYRDDYKIFVNNSEDGEEILKIISIVLSSLGLKLNTLKTKSHEDIILNGVKKGKIEWLAIQKKQKTFQKELMVIYYFSKKYKNSASLINSLNKFYKKIESIKDGTFEWKKENIKVLISIITQISYENSKSYNIVAAILSKLFKQLEELDREEIINKVLKKLKLVLNVGYFEIWLQRAIIKEKVNIEFEEKICKIVASGEGTLWNNDWIASKKIKNILNQNSIVNQKLLNETNEVISSKEVDVFKKLQNY